MVLFLGTPKIPLNPPLQKGDFFRVSPFQKKGASLRLPPFSKGGQGGIFGQATPQVPNYFEKRRYHGPSSQETPSGNICRSRTSRKLNTL
jgi:hypothetical protein